MAWKQSENASPEKPVAIDETSSNTTVFVRRNFVKIPERTVDDMVIPEHWVYEEEHVPKDQWTTYRASMENSANIDYLAMEMGVDL